VNAYALAAIKKAIAAEIAAADLYTRLAALAGNPESGGIFAALVADEVRHRGMLEMRIAEATGQAYVAGPFQPVALPPAASGMLWPAALTLAIRGETAAHDGYVKEAARTTDAEGKAMFTHLAEDEAGHRRLLEAEYAARIGQPFAEYEQGTWVRE
jgi:rubrerythrin